MERISYQDTPKNMFEKLMVVEDYLNGSPLEMSLLELIRLRTAQLNNCAYCVDMHYKELKHLGESELRLSSLCVWSETPYFSDKERKALELTEILTRDSQSTISDEYFETLLSQFSKEEICYLTIVISHLSTWAKLMKTLKFTPGKYEVKK
ncbi:AhpD family alkylhydroperoxidase [Ancylomarina subtilis]|uniref:AhpD family alkylhydroperoxidase n=1 Tax=Ancylomarina subtilis TaxID=1639035 RepID=A0A4Q7VKF9_9BACT|nr:carboxymuconolactone decarboxylase family protein [Ancylomarina subtilis]RZT96703.1 AhpD family alkylhydroperoxidase [Ancylomarina subtilis]